MKQLLHRNMENIQGFYDNLRNEYNPQLVKDIKLYKQFTSNLKKREIQRKFLLECRKKPERPLTLMLNLSNKLRKSLNIIRV